MYVITRVEDGVTTVVDCNKLFLKMLGYTRADVVGTSLTTFYSDASRRAADKAPGNVGLDAVERQLVAKYGGVLDTLLHAVPETDVDGAVIGTRAVYVDITERKQAEARQREAESTYRLLVEQSLIGLYIIQDGRVVYVNPKMSDISGYPTDGNAQLFSVLDLIVEEDRELVSDNLRRRMAGETIEQGYVVRISRRDGRIVPMEVHNALIEYRGRPAVAGVALDISERQQLEAQLKQAHKLESIGTLAGGVAHAFNNALTAICGRCELLLGDVSMTDAHRSDVEAILKVAEESAALTRQLLAVGHHQVLDPKDFDLNVAVGKTLEMAEPLIGEQIRVAPDLEPKLGLVRADAAQIEEVLVNLLLNARDAMPEGGTLTVATASVDVDEAFRQVHPEVGVGPYVRLTVRDTGSGMSAETLEHIFEPFFTTKEFGRGSGLGLATVHGIITQTGGHILVESAETGGTTFSIFLPRLSDDARERSDGRDDDRLETVLLVEDEPHVRRTVTGMLAPVGYHVLTAGNGDDALTISSLHHGPIDLLLTDVVMPGMNGWQLAAELTRQHPGLKVLYMTGYGNPQRPGELGDDHSLLQKPFAPRGLLRAVRQALGPDDS